MLKASQKPIKTGGQDHDDEKHAGTNSSRTPVAFKRLPHRAGAEAKAEKPKQQKL